MVIQLLAFVRLPFPRHYPRVILFIPREKSHRLRRRQPRLGISIIFKYIIFCRKIKCRIYAYVRPPGNP